jgi:hypothetical protein
MLALLQPLDPPSLALSLVVFAEPDLKEYEADEPHQAAADQHGREDLAGLAWDRGGTDNAGHNQQAGGAVGEDARSTAHAVGRYMLAATIPIALESG